MSNTMQNAMDSAKDVIQAAGDLANNAVDQVGNAFSDGGTEVRFFCTLKSSFRV